MTKRDTILGQIGTKFDDKVGQFDDKERYHFTIRWTEIKDKAGQT